MSSRPLDLADYANPHFYLETAEMLLDVSQEMFPGGNVTLANCIIALNNAFAPRLLNAKIHGIDPSVAAQRFLEAVRRQREGWKVKQKLDAIARSN